MLYWFLFTSFYSILYSLFRLGKMRIFQECGGLKASRDHVTSLTTKLNEQRKTDENFCDITLTCGGVTFPAHKAILCASSPYFECLLGDKFAEGEQNEIDLTESIGDPDTLEIILKFIYTGNLLIEGSNFRELLSASSLLLLNDATKLLSYYLTSSLVIANCLEIFEIAFKYCLEEVVKLCYGIIKSRMHDYFCHGSKMLTVPVEIFVHLCKRDVFINTSKQDINNTIKEYLNNIKALNIDLSQENITKLYEIAESYEMTDIKDVFEKWIPVGNEEKDVKLVEPVLNVDDVKRNPLQSNEILLIKSLENLENMNEVGIIGWLGTASKWIKIASINLSSLRIDYLGRFVGFANDSMVFEIQSKQKTSKTHPKNIILIPLYAGKARKIACACSSWYRRNIDEDDDECDNLYFTAWNELFCVVPQIDLDFGDSSWDSDGFAKGKGEKIVTGYTIDKKSSQDDKTWEEVCTLPIPRDYFVPGVQLHIDPPMRFQVSMDGNHAILVMDNGEDYLTVIELTPDDTGKTLKSNLIFHEDIESDRFTSQTLMKATQARLIFLDVCYGNKSLMYKSSTFYFEYLTELNMSNNKQAQKVKVSDINDNNCFPVSDYHEYIAPAPFHKKYYMCPNVWKYGKRDRMRFVTSRQSGILHVIERVVPYITEMWSFDPIKNVWRSLPGPPCEFMYDSVDIQQVPANLLPELVENPPVIFDDKHDNIKHGPFHPDKPSKSVY